MIVSHHRILNWEIWTKIPHSFKINLLQGCLGGSVGWVSDLGSGHDLAVCEFKPCVGLCADSLDPGACFWFCVSPLGPPPHSRSVSLSLSLLQKLKKEIKGKYGRNRAEFWHRQDILKWRERNMVEWPIFSGKEEVRKSIEIKKS